MKTAHDLVVAAKQHIHEVSLDEAAAAIQSADLLIDVREPAEYQQGHIAGAINIPRGLLEFKMDGSPELEDRAKFIVIYCKTSGRAALSAASLHEMGFVNVASISGGYDAWAAAGHPVAQPKLPEFE